jgi:hypothetical protein
MIRVPLRILMALCVSIPVIAAQGGKGATTTLTGWFSDEGCARSKINSGEIGPNGRDCVQRCLKEGKKLVFIDEKAKALLFVDNPAAAGGQESHYVEVTGTADRATKTLHMESIKVLEEYKAMCARRKLKE